MTACAPRQTAAVPGKGINPNRLMARLFHMPVLCALFWCGSFAVLAQDPPPIPANVTKADYLRDTARAAQLAIHEAEIGLKYNAGKITGEAYYPDFTKTRKELNELRVKWGQVSPKMGVQFVFDYRQRSDRQISTLRGQYAPKPVERPKPPQVYRGEPEPAPPEPYRATPEQRRELWTWAIIGAVVWLALMIIFGGRRKDRAGPPPKPLSDNYGTASILAFQDLSRSLCIKDRP